MAALASGIGWSIGGAYPASSKCYLDGNTDEITAQRVRDHLEECGRCGLDDGTYQAIIKALARHEQPTDSAVDRLCAFGESLMSQDTTGREL
ncbi:MAG: zf-HC2 domain-containing protein [Catenulispora sp.]|nr:zf-HC2 domain-containing protein [Catenulispora sp.]